eukprot:Clim_evm6s240 gene=Clim_evmTU6s240
MRAKFIAIVPVGLEHIAAKDILRNVKGSELIGNYCERLLPRQAWDLSREERKQLKPHRREKIKDYDFGSNKGQYQRGLTPSKRAAKFMEDPDSDKEFIGSAMDPNAFEGSEDPVTVPGTVVFEASYSSLLDAEATAADQPIVRVASQLLAYVDTIHLPQFRDTKEVMWTKIIKQVEKGKDQERDQGQTDRSTTDNQRPFSATLMSLFDDEGLWPKYEAAVRLLDHHYVHGHASTLAWTPQGARERVVAATLERDGGPSTETQWTSTSDVDASGMHRHHYFRVTAMRARSAHVYPDDERNHGQRGASVQAAGQLATGPCQRYNYDVKLKEASLDLAMILHRPAGSTNCRLMLGVTLDKNHGVAYPHKGRTALSGSIASTMVLLGLDELQKAKQRKRKERLQKLDDEGAVQKSQGLVMLDPMAGTGVIPMEAARLYPAVTLALGSDFDTKGLTPCKENYNFFTTAFSGTGTARIANLGLVCADATQGPWKDCSIDLVVSDLPYGRRHGSYNSNRRLYPRFLRQLGRMLRVGGIAVLLTSERGGMRTSLRHAGVALPEKDGQPKGARSAAGEEKVAGGLVTRNSPLRVLKVFDSENGGLATSIYVLVKEDWKKTQEHQVVSRT